MRRNPGEQAARDGVQCGGRRCSAECGGATVAFGGEPARGVIATPAGDGAAPARPAYDYVLAVGPGRSGSTFLYRLLNRRAGFVAPSIKEGCYYRSPRRLARARRRIGDPRAILLDVANLAWSDPALVRVAGLGALGHAVLVVVLLRRHRDRAVSMLDFRRSRVVPGLLLGPRRLERAVLADSLTPRALERIFGLGVDVLTIGFEALTADTQCVLDLLARLCATNAIEAAEIGPANASARARSAVPVAGARAVAVVLRGIGAHRLLQWLKDRPGVMRAFFRPARADERARLGAGAEEELERRYEACVRTVEAASERLAGGVWFRRARMECREHSEWTGLGPK